MLVRQAFRIVRFVLTILVALPIAAQAAQTPVATTDNQIALYAAQRLALAGQGQELIEWFLDGNEEAFLDRSSPEIRNALAGASFAELRRRLETNRVSMDYPDQGAQFSGYFDGSQRISGSYDDGNARSFVLTAEEAQAGDAPTGRWTGMILPDQTEISVVFSGSIDALTATIDVPAEDVEGAPLSNVTFAPEQSIGEVVSTQALPMSPMLRSYTEVREWGSTYLVIYLILDPDGNIVGFRFTVPPPVDPDSLVDPSEVDITYPLPGNELLIVYSGGQGRAPSFHNDLPGWRHGYEFAIWRDGSTYAGEGASNDDYHIWGLPVLSPVAGTVVAVENGMPDLPPGQSFAEADTPDLGSGAQRAGNHVVIETADNVWIVLAHMQQGSIPVAVGDTVQVGDQVGLVGHSGAAPEPLLHVHAQSSADLDAASAVPVVFSGVAVDGEPASGPVLPYRGQFVAPST